MGPGQERDDSRWPEERDAPDDPEAPALTARELEVLTLASRGRTNREIADALDLAPSTVKTHLERIYGKLDAAGRASAVAAAIRFGLID